MTWAQRLKRAFNIDIEMCGECGGTAKVIACIEDPVVIPKTLRGAGSREDTDPRRKSRCDRNDPVARVSGAATAKCIRAWLRNLNH